MKLLFDQNLASRLVRLLSDLYPDSQHVHDVGLGRADDSSVWEYAKQNAMTIVSKDGDFHQRSFVYGQPPKVIWVRRGNCSTATIEQLLRHHYADIVAFLDDPDTAFLALA